MISSTSHHSNDDSSIIEGELEQSSKFKRARPNPSTSPHPHSKVDIKFQRLINEVLSTASSKENAEIVEILTERRLLLCIAQKILDPFKFKSLTGKVTYCRRL